MKHIHLMAKVRYIVPNYDQLWKVFQKIPFMFTLCSRQHEYGSISFKQSPGYVFKSSNEDFTVQF